jgi:hypothetical protein
MISCQDLLIVTGHADKLFSWTSMEQVELLNSLMLLPNGNCDLIDVTCHCLCELWPL